MLPYKMACDLMEALQEPLEWTHTDQGFLHANGTLLQTQQVFDAVKLVLVYETAVIEPHYTCFHINETSMVRSVPTIGRRTRQHVVGVFPHIPPDGESFGAFLNERFGLLMVQRLRAVSHVLALLDLEQGTWSAVYPDIATTADCDDVALTPDDGPNLALFFEHHEWHLPNADLRFETPSSLLLQRIVSAHERVSLQPHIDWVLTQFDAFGIVVLRRSP